MFQFSRINFGVVTPSPIGLQFSQPVLHSVVLHCAGRFSEALVVCKAGIEVDADSFLCLVNAGIEEAIISFESARKLSNKQFMPVHGLIWTYCLIGRSDKARELMNELKERSKSEYVANTFTACLPLT